MDKAQCAKLLKECSEEVELELKYDAHGYATYDQVGRGVA